MTQSNGTGAPAGGPLEGGAALWYWSGLLVPFDNPTPDGRTARAPAPGVEVADLATLPLPVIWHVEQDHDALGALLADTSGLALPNTLTVGEVTELAYGEIGGRRGLFGAGMLDPAAEDMPNPGVAAAFAELLAAAYRARGYFRLGVGATLAAQDLERAEGEGFAFARWKLGPVRIKPDPAWPHTRITLSRTPLAAVEAEADEWVLPTRTPDVPRAITLLRELDRTQQDTDRSGGREIAWYYMREQIEDALGVVRGGLEAGPTPEAGQ